MARLDGPLRAAAKLLLSQLGATATLRRVTTTHTFTSDASSEATTEVIVKASPPEPYNSRMVDGTMVLAGDARCLVAGAALDTLSFPLPAGTLQRVSILFGSEKWNVVAVNQIRSGDQVAAVELQLRR